MVVLDGQESLPKRQGVAHHRRLRRQQRLPRASLESSASKTGRYTTNLTIKVCHLPPGTSKWNKIEHRLFSFITQNWRGKPLISHEVIVSLIAATTTKAGLTVNCAMDTTEYPTGQAVSDEEFADVRITHADFHGEWNYAIRPKFVKFVA